MPDYKQLIELIEELQRRVGEQDKLISELEKKADEVYSAYENEYWIKE